MDLNFNTQQHDVRLSPRAYGDIEYKQRKNWNAKNQIQRERAYLMFDRLHQALFNLANTTDFSGFKKFDNGTYQYITADGFAVINFELVKVVDSLVIYVTNFVWPYKKDPNSWWKVVETKHTIKLTEKELMALLSECIHKALNRITV